MTTTQLITASFPVRITDDHVSPHDANTAFAAGVEPCVIIYQRRVQPEYPAINRQLKRENVSWHDARLWDDRVIRDVLWSIDEQALRTHLIATIPTDYAGYVMVDLEPGFMWPGMSFYPIGSPPWEASMILGNTVIDIVKRHAPSAKIGLYNVNYFPKNTHGRMAYLVESVGKVNEQRRRLNVDVFYPSVYDVFPGESEDHDWNTKARVGSVAASSRPVIPVINPYVMARTGWTLMTPEEYRRDQLALAMGAGADGVCFWNNRYDAVEDGWIPPARRGIETTIEEGKAHMDIVGQVYLGLAYLHGLGGG